MEVSRVRGFLRRQAESGAPWFDPCMDRDILDHCENHGIHGKSWIRNPAKTAEIFHFFNNRPNANRVLFETLPLSRVTAMKRGEHVLTDVFFNEAQPSRELCDECGSVIGVAYSYGAIKVFPPRTGTLHVWGVFDGNASNKVPEEKQFCEHCVENTFFRRVEYANEPLKVKRIRFSHFQKK